MIPPIRSHRDGRLLRGGGCDEAETIIITHDSMRHKRPSQHGISTCIITSLFSRSRPHIPASACIRRRPRVVTVHAAPTNREARSRSLSSLFIHTAQQPDLRQVCVRDTARDTESRYHIAHSFQWFRVVVPIRAPPKLRCPRRIAAAAPEQPTAHQAPAQCAHTPPPASIGLIPPRHPPSRRWMAGTTPRRCPSAAAHQDSRMIPGARCRRF